MSRQEAPGFISEERVVLRLFHRLESVDQLVRRLAEHERARDLGEEAAGTVVLDQEHHVVAGLSVRPWKWRPAKRAGWPTGADEHRKMPCSLPSTRPVCSRERGHVIVGHAGLDGLRHFGEDLIRISQQRRHQCDLFLALDRLQLSINSVASTNFAPLSSFLEAA